MGRGFKLVHKILIGPRGLLIVGNLRKSKVMSFLLSAGAERLALGFLRVLRTLTWGLGRSPIYKSLRRSGSPRWHTPNSNPLLRSPPPNQLRKLSHIVSLSSLESQGLRKPKKVCNKRVPFADPSTIKKFVLP